MTLVMSPELAKKFGDAHEISFPNEEGERMMDLYNHQIGRELALESEMLDVILAPLSWMPCGRDVCGLVLTDIRKG